MLLTVFSLLSYLTLLISAAPGYIHEKRPSYSSYYSGRRNVSPRSVAINSRYSHAIRTRNPHGGGGGGGGKHHGHHRYGGPPPILQTATTLINVHPTSGYQKCGPENNQNDCSPHIGRQTTTEEPAVYEEPSTTTPCPPTTEAPVAPKDNGPATSTSTSTTTELNIYQGRNKVVEFRTNLPGGQGGGGGGHPGGPMYPPYQPPPPPPVYQPPPPPPYIPPPPPPPPRYAPSPPPPRYAPSPPRPQYMPPPEATEQPYARPGETVIRIGPKDDDEYGKKKYKVLICKLQQK